MIMTKEEYGGMIQHLHRQIGQWKRHIKHLLVENPMKLNCNHPGCNTEFKIDCSTRTIYEHLFKAHNIDVTKPLDLIKASFMIKAMDEVASCSEIVNEEEKK